MCVLLLQILPHAQAKSTWFGNTECLNATAFRRNEKRGSVPVWQLQGEKNLSSLQEDRFIKEFERETVSLSSSFKEPAGEKDLFSFQEDPFIVEFEREVVNLSCDFKEPTWEKNMYGLRGESGGSDSRRVTQQKISRPNVAQPIIISNNKQKNE